MIDDKKLMDAFRTLKCNNITHIGKAQMPSTFGKEPIKCDPFSFTLCEISMTRRVSGCFFLEAFQSMFMKSPNNRMAHEQIIKTASNPDHLYPFMGYTQGNT